MGFVDFVKSVFSGRQEAAEQDVETVSWEHLPSWTQTKQASLEKEGKEAVSELQEALTQLTEQLDEKIPLLAAVDVDKFKTEQRAKHIVKNGIKQYIGFVQRLQRDLLDIPYTDLDMYTAHMEKCILDFMNKSAKSYQKTQYLIGKELAAVKDPLANFYTFQKKFRDENEYLITSKKSLTKVQEKIENANQTQESCKEMKKNIATLNADIKKIQEQNKKISTTLQQTKESKEYLANKQKEKELEVEKDRLKDEYENLRRIIDFKALAREFHTSPKHMQIVKAYKDDFINQVTTDEGKQLQSLLQEARQYDNTIAAQLKKTKDLNSKLPDKKTSNADDTLEPLLEQIRTNETELATLQKQKKQQTGSYEKILKTKESVINTIKEELKQMNVELELSN